MSNKCHAASCGIASVRIPWWIAALLTCAAISGVASPGAALSSPATAERHWTLQDIVQAPLVDSLSIAEDGKSALYAIRQGDLATNTRTSQLHRVDLATGEDKLIKSLSWLQNLQHIPGSADWSVLADLGEGVQLYRVDETGEFTPLVVNHHTDLMGYADEAARPVGVSGYGWTSDGNLWYEKRSSARGNERIVDPPFFPIVFFRGTAPFELHFVHKGKDYLVNRLEAGSASFLRVGWDARSSTLSYWVRVRDDSLEKRLWSPGKDTPRKARSARSNYIPGTDSDQGRFDVVGYGNARKLVLNASDGSVRDYGHVEFSLGYSRLGGTWWSPDRKTALFGTRRSDVPRYGLARLTASGAIKEVAESRSLTNCSVNSAFTAAVCVRQSMASPPELVALDPRAGDVRSIVGLAPGYSAIEPLKVVPGRWTNRNGFKANGLVVYPRNYRPGQKYPAILVTHGSDADERFVDFGFQWNYPVQALAERGYVVVAMNSPSSRESAELAAAYAQWGGDKGPLPLERVQDLIWINGAWSFEDAIKELVADGLVDPRRVGIAGYSFGSQMVNATMTQSKVFRAASSGDGGVLEPSAYFVLSDVYRSIFGGSPYDAKAVPNYQRLSPTFRAKLAAGPVLQQVAAGLASQLELHVALRQAGNPSELVYYPNETHLFHQPRHQLTAMQENIDWFDFWLLGKEDPDPAKAQQYKRWRAMRGAQREQPAQEH